MCVLKIYLIINEKLCIPSSSSSHRQGKELEAVSSCIVSLTEYNYRLPTYPSYPDST